MGKLLTEGAEMFPNFIHGEFQRIWIANWNK